MNRKTDKRLRDVPNVNFRPLSFVAMGLCLGVLLAFRIAFGGFSYADLAFPVLFFALLLRPLSRKRLLAVLLSVVVAAGIGAGLAIWSVKRYEAGPASGYYEVTGTVVSTQDMGGYSTVVLSRLTFDGTPAAGKLRGYATGNLRQGDKIVFSGSIENYGRPSGDSPYSQSLFGKDVRYGTGNIAFDKTGVTKDPFLRLRAYLYDVLHDNMEKDEADVAYGLLLGDTGGMDETIVGAVRRGGISHVFAVSGLHIGILFAAVQLACRRLKRFSSLPAIALSLCYVALCGFTASALRAFIMCSVYGIWKARARKYDFLESLSLAAIIELLIMPAQLITVGFRLSFGACLGIGLLSGSFSRGLEKIHCPRRLARYISATFSVQIFTFPILLESFGYFSVWGLLLNLLIIPLLPVLFLSVLLSSLFVAIIPAAGALLALPEAGISLFLYLFTVTDFSFVLMGFSLATGSVVWLTACVLLSERVRMEKWMRAATAGLLCTFFTVLVLLRNVVFAGCYVLTYESFGAHAVLIRTRSENVLVIDEEISISACEDFLNRNYGGTLDAVVVVADDEVQAINVAAFLKTKEIRAFRETETGLQETTVLFGESFSYGEVQFFYETRKKLAVIVQDALIEIDFTGSPAIGATLFIGAETKDCFYTIHDGIVRQRIQ